METTVSYGEDGVRPYPRIALQVLADCIGVSLVVTLAVGLLTEPYPASELVTLFAEVWLYTMIIAAFAHVIMPRLYLTLVHRHPVERWAVMAIVLIAISAIGGLIGGVIIAASDLEPGTTFRQIASLGITISIVLALLVGTIHAILYLLRYRLSEAALKLRVQEIEYERALKLAAEARLAALEARIHPHFLFNALNTVSSLIPTDPARAEGLVERLSALLRFCLEVHQDRLVPLRQEIKVVKDYLEIEQARFGSRLQVTFDVSDGLAETQIPPLSVQTLVENSVKHAVTASRAGGEIRVRAKPLGDEACIEVADRGPGFSLTDLPPGHGLQILRDRLAALFGDTEPLRVRQDGWTTIGFRVPT